MCFFFFQAEDGIRDLVRSRGLGDVYKRQGLDGDVAKLRATQRSAAERDFYAGETHRFERATPVSYTHLTLPTSDLV